MSVYERRESAVRSYCRSFPAVFARAEGARVFDQSGRGYIDFLSGAGSLNYGHNPAPLREALVRYIQSDGITLSLDLHTEAKSRFLELFERLILQPRDLDYVVQFPGPTGTNAVEAALKLARKKTGRSNIVAFTNGFHGMTLGALAATGNSGNRAAAGMLLTGVSRFPYDGYLGGNAGSLEFLERALDDPSSGIDLPAAVIVECVQGEGGLNAASMDWLRRLDQLCRRHSVLLIVDDIQAGCGRTGTFFSFEPAGIRPDIVTLSKSLSGFGLPLSAVLIDRRLDVWQPGEHNGTFRGNNHAFVTAASALEMFWSDDRLMDAVGDNAAVVTSFLDSMINRHGGLCVAKRGRGMMQGLEMRDGDMASAIIAACFERGLIIEASGARGEVLKCLAPLTIELSSLAEGLDMLANAIGQVLKSGADG